MELQSFVVLLVKSLGKIRDRNGYINGERDSVESATSSLRDFSSENQALIFPLLDDICDYQSPSCDLSLLCRFG